MYREYYAQVQANFEQRVENALEDAAVIHIGGTVQSDEGVAIGQPVHLALESLGQKPYQGIDHDVAHTIDFGARDALAAKISIRILGVSKQKIGDPVCDEPVDLFRHGSVEGTEARFYMANWDQ